MAREPKLSYHRNWRTGLRLKCLCLGGCGFEPHRFQLFSEKLFFQIENNVEITIELKVTSKPLRSGLSEHYSSPHEIRRATYLFLALSLVAWSEEI